MASFPVINDLATLLPHLLEIRLQRTLDLGSYFLAALVPILPGCEMELCWVISQRQSKEPEGVCIEQSQKGLQAVRAGDPLFFLHPGAGDMLCPPKKGPQPIAGHMLWR